MDKKTIQKNVSEERENQNDRFRTTYGNKNDFNVLRVEIIREKTGETVNYEFNSSDLTEKDSIHFSTEVVNGKFRVIWDNFIADKAKLI